MTNDFEAKPHYEWIGYVQPVGLVVSAPALLAAQAYVNRNIVPDHQRFLDCLGVDKGGETIGQIRDFSVFTENVLGWRATDLETVVPGDAAYTDLEVALPEFHETLRPTHVVREPEPDTKPWMMLVQVLKDGQSLDAVSTEHDRNWQATPQAKFERLLRETQVPVGILTNGIDIRLVYAPRGETSGHATFNVPHMRKVEGRPIFAALHMLLCDERLFAMAVKQRLPAILADSRKYQNHVSKELAEQVLAALYELVRGFQSANERTQGDLLRDVLAKDPNHVYSGLLTVLMRLVFVLYAEDRDLLSTDPVYTNHYAVTGLFDRLRADAGRYPDTMDQRPGAWAQLLTLFRLIHEGGQHGGLRIPPRHGYLFDPDRYPFLEGRQHTAAEVEEVPGLPYISDGVVFNVLKNLLILDGERLSYRSLDVEQIGSVYETMMGFDLEVAKGASIALKPSKPHGAPPAVNLDALLAVKPADRAGWLKSEYDQAVTGAALEGVKKAISLDDLLAALEKRIAVKVTPGVVPKGAMVLQPSNERRRSGSHYTPRSLTAPIVQTTLEPILRQLGSSPTPEQLLDLKICDPAMGSGAFLVETCRQLGAKLEEAWTAHGLRPDIPPDEDGVLHAQRLIAQRCLYGVDKNPMAVDLAKLSLWLATLAKDHPFTFLDHSLRCGDSLVGLSQEQIGAVHWIKSAQKTFLGGRLSEQVKNAAAERSRILNSRDDVTYDELQHSLYLADLSLNNARFIGNVVISAFFEGKDAKARLKRLAEVTTLLEQHFTSETPEAARKLLDEAVANLRAGRQGIAPFHWHIEFPEVFAVNAAGKPTHGFDAIVGNPPYSGVVQLAQASGDRYPEFLRTMTSGASGQVDLVAFFFRSAFANLRNGGCLGFISTNTIAQGDTRESGLAWICENGGLIFDAVKRKKWPGRANVTVCFVSIAKGLPQLSCRLDDRIVYKITAFLLPTGGHRNPVELASRPCLAAKGIVTWGMGFVFEDGCEGQPNIEVMNRILDRNLANKSRIRRYVGGADLNALSDLTPHRFIIDLDGLTFTEAAQFPDLLNIVEQFVKPMRLRLPEKTANKRLRERWWHFSQGRELRDAIKGLERILVCSQTSKHRAFGLIDATWVLDQKAMGFALGTYAFFCVMQSRLHEHWSEVLGSYLEDRPVYTPSTCFETYPFPIDWESMPIIEQIGRHYYDFRADLMVQNNEGFTKTYNRFHDPDERLPDIHRLRELHAEMDRAVFEAYQWHDLAKRATCDFFLDYEDEEEDDAPAGRKAKKKPYRYRWPDEFRDEVLARLLELNQTRAQEEQIAGLTIAVATAEEMAASKLMGHKSPPKRKAGSGMERLLDVEKGNG